jgi:hypothetical protein
MRREGKEKEEEFDMVTKRVKSNKSTVALRAINRRNKNQTKIR